MKMNLLTPLTLLACTLAIAMLAADKPFPAHWGKPPQIQTQDYGDLPGGYGKGSSTLAKWITAKLEQDKLAGKGPAATAKPLFEANFEQTELEKVPDGFLVLDGAFAVKAEGGNKFLELPGAPLDTFGVLFGPTEKENLCVQARINATGKGRRFPVFAVGLNGVGGYKLQVAPAKKVLELVKLVGENDQAVASVPFEWQSGSWTVLRLQVRRVKDGQWKVEGKAWPQSGKEPAAWQISYDESPKEDKDAPKPGRPSIWGNPFSGTPIQFDDLSVTAVK